MRLTTKRPRGWRRRLRPLLLVLVALGRPGPPCTGAEELRSLPDDQRYFNTPDDMLPYRRQDPYVRFFLDSWETGLYYYGPGREYPEPDGLESVKIGFVGPIERIIPYTEGDAMPHQYFQMGQYMFHGALLALEEANAMGGYRDKLPFELVTKNDPVVQVDHTWMWAPFSGNVVDLCYQDKVWALFGTIGGENSHILIRIALKVEIPIMNTADTDPTFPETRIPWLFRVISDDRIQCYALAKYAYDIKGYQRVAVLRYGGRYGRVGTKEFREASQRLRRPIPIELRFNNGETDFRDRLERIRGVNPDAVFVWGNAVECGRIIKQMREMGMTQPVLGSDRMLDPDFVRIAGSAAEGTVASSPWDPTRENEQFDAFRTQYMARFDGEEPETYAAHAYDGMRMLLLAINEAGLNRALIRDALERWKREPFPGVTGPIPLNDILVDAGEIAIAKLENGSWRFFSEADAGIQLPRVVPKEAPPAEGGDQ
ncbi:MAG: ABC transporter substrate-binding protein [Verrucomicrobiota bacterium]|nr:ABC transporter substrate-binding protein [Verrucomicrobiota bacterium]